ncbi:energy transducer TonB, partial [Plastoroseomonas hellenica]
LRAGGGDNRPGADVPSTAPAIAPVASVTPAASAPAGGGPLLITAPRYRRTPTPPQYPSRALDLGITGTVLVRARVAPGGETEETRVWRSSGHPMLDAAALAAVRRWAFEPASIGGRQVESWVEVPVHFRLN